jgi:DTW domain-containing protein YfiP
MAEAVDEKLRKKLSNFQVNHHDTLVSYYKEKMEWWRLQTDVEKQRCKVCWLRIHQCYCETLRKKREVYTSWEPKPNASVCMYYNAVEIARSANTAHVLEATCPHLVYSIIQGDLDKEKQLMDEIEREFRENDPQTCIMFPSKDAKLLSEWMAARPVREFSAPVRLVMLDGTFPGAARIAKYMINCCALRGIPAPLVKLDLEGDACKSAVAGMMYQPGQ